MRICLNRATAGAGLPFEQFVEIAARAGFAGADVDMAWAATHGQSALADLYGKHQLSFGGWGLPNDWRGDATAAAQGRETLDKQAKEAAKLGIDSCATWLLPASDLPFSENWRFHVERLSLTAKVLANHGLRFGLEFVAPYHLRRKWKHEFIFTPMAMLELAADVGSNCGLLVDCFHLHAAGEPMSILPQIPASKIVLVHLNDAPAGSLDQVQDSKRLLPGHGIIDLVGFFAGLKKTNYTGPISLEVFSDELKALPPAEAANRAWAATKKMLATVA
jgi:sugar phosphate isomerase/epimerase